MLYHIGYKTICIITGKVFYNQQAEMEITETLAGPIWLGLWHNPDNLKFKDGWGLIPQYFKGRYKAVDKLPEEFFEED